MLFQGNSDIGFLFHLNEIYAYYIHIWKFIIRSQINATNALLLKIELNLQIQSLWNVSFLEIKRFFLSFSQIFLRNFHSSFSQSQQTSLGT